MLSSCMSYGIQLGRGCAVHGGSGTWQGVHRRRRCSRPRTGSQHETISSVWKMLRILQRGSVPVRQDGGVFHQRSGEDRYRNKSEALRREQPGENAHVRQFRRRRKGSERDLSEGVRDRGEGGASFDRDVLIQQGGWHVFVGEQMAAHRRSS